MFTKHSCGVVDNDVTTDAQIHSHQLKIQTKVKLRVRFINAQKSLENVK